MFEHFFLIDSMNCFIYNMSISTTLTTLTTTTTSHHYTHLHIALRCSTVHSTLYPPRTCLGTVAKSNSHTLERSRDLLRWSPSPDAPVTCSCRLFPPRCLLGVRVARWSSSEWLNRAFALWIRWERQLRRRIACYFAQQASQHWAKSRQSSRWCGRRRTCFRETWI